MVIKNLSRIRLGDREIRILIFLWKWKLATTAALTSKRFFPNACPKSAYNRLFDLKHVGLIEMRGDAKLQNFAWVLTMKGFRAIREFLPALREEGFGVEYFEHDLWVSAFHLGGWLYGLPSFAKVFTEQELRRCVFEEYPSWVPKTEVHRPDGYFGIAAEGRMIPIAIEVELNRKPTAAYSGLGRFYADLSPVHRVLWVVPSHSAAQRMDGSLSVSNQARSGLHNFILLSDFRKQGWDAAVVHGPDAGKTVHNFLIEMPQAKGRQTPGLCPAHLLLDTKRSYTKSRSSGKPCLPLKAQQPMLPA